MGTARAYFYSLLEAERPQLFGKVLRVFIGLLIIANAIAVILESDRALWLAHKPLFVWFEALSVGFFSVEYLFRVWTAAENPAFADLGAWQARKAYIFSPIGIVDLVAIAPFYLAFMIPWDLRQLRALRLLRLLKLSRYFRSIELLFSVIRSQIPLLLGTTLLVLIMIIFSSSLMYVVESKAQPEAFGSIGRSIWWAVVTLTTVGYGDVTPITLLGRVLGMFIMLLGVGLVALPAAILAGRFADELQFQRERLSNKAAFYLQDGDLDETERKSLMELGEESGFSEEDVHEIAEEAQESEGFLRPCPRCGYERPQ